MKEIEEYLQKQNEEFLIECFYEIEEWRHRGILKDGKVYNIANKFNINVTQLYMLPELIYRCLAILFVQSKNNNNNYKGGK